MWNFSSFVSLPLIWFSMANKEGREKKEFIKNQGVVK